MEAVEAVVALAFNAFAYAFQRSLECDFIRYRHWNGMALHANDRWNASLMRLMVRRRPANELLCVVFCCVLFGLFVCFAHNTHTQHNARHAILVGEWIGMAMEAVEAVVALSINAFAHAFQRSLECDYHLESLLKGMA